MAGSCLDCTERTVEPNCHTNCVRYLEEVEKLREIRKLMNEDLNRDVDTYGYCNNAAIER